MCICYDVDNLKECISVMMLITFVGTQAVSGQKVQCCEIGGQGMFFKILQEILEFEGRNGKNLLQKMKSK